MKRDSPAFSTKGLEKVLKLSQKKFGPENLVTIGYRRLVAMNYQLEGRWDEARAMLETNMEICECSLGADAIESAMTRYHLAMCYEELGRHKQALPLYEASQTAFENLDRDPHFIPFREYTPRSRDAVKRLQEIVGY